MSFQITAAGAVVRDLERSMESLWKLFGMGPWKINRHREGHFLSAVFQTDKILFELVQPTEGGSESVYASFLKERGEGLYHVCFSFPSEKEKGAFVSSLKEKGLRVSALYTEAGTQERICFDSWDSLGFALEIRSGKDEGQFTWYPDEYAVPDFRARQYIRQIGIVVRDNKETMRNFAYYLGIDGWTTVSFSDRNLNDFRIKGKVFDGKYEFLCSVKWIGDIEFELVEPLDGPLIYFDFLKKKGPGFNHVKSVMTQPELEKLFEHADQYGIHDIESGRLTDNHHYNLNTDGTVGFVMELGNGGKSIAAS